MWESMEFDRLLVLYKLVASHILLPVVLGLFFGYERNKWRLSKYFICSLPLILFGLVLSVWKPTTFVDWWAGCSTWLFVPYVISVQLIFTKQFNKLATAFA